MNERREGAGRFGRKETNQLFTPLLETIGYTRLSADVGHIVPPIISYLGPSSVLLMVPDTLDRPLTLRFGIAIPFQISHFNALAFVAH